MTWLISFTILSFINPFGLDGFVLSKAWLVSFILLFSQKKIDINIYYVLIWCALFLFVYTSMDWSKSLIGEELLGFNGLVQIGLYIFLFHEFVGVGDISETLILCSIPMLALAILQKTGAISNQHNWGHYPLNRAISTQGNPVFLSMILGMLVPIVWNSWGNAKINRTAYFGYFCLLIAALWSCGSRIGWLESVVGLAAYYL